MGGTAKREPSTTCGAGGGVCAEQPLGMFGKEVRRHSPLNCSTAHDALDMQLLLSTHTCTLTPTHPARLGSARPLVPTSPARMWPNAPARPTQDVRNRWFNKEAEAANMLQGGTVQGLVEQCSYGQMTFRLSSNLVVPFIVPLPCSGTGSKGPWSASQCGDPEKFGFAEWAINYVRQVGGGGGDWRGGEGLGLFGLPVRAVSGPMCKALGKHGTPTGAASPACRMLVARYGKAAHQMPVANCIKPALKVGPAEQCAAFESPTWPGPALLCPFKALALPI